MDFKAILKNDKAVRLIFIAGFALIGLIFAVGFFEGEEKPVQASSMSVADETSVFRSAITAEATEMLSAIEGVGNVKVNITLDGRMEYSYITEENRDENKTTASGEQTANRYSYEKKIIYIEDENGRKQALLRTTVEPDVKGVLVVCSGGDDPFVIEKITNAMSTMLGVPASRVCVTKLS